MTEAATSFDIYDPHASKRTEIDHQVLLLRLQVRLLRQQIQNLHAERNTLVPISSIPNEIISDIFLLCRSRDQVGRVDMRALLPLTWVCHRWRTLALSIAPLWAYVGEENRRWAKECLARSKQAPLEVHLAMRKSPSIKVAAVALSQIHRIRQLTLHFNGQSDATNKLQGFLTQPVPMLESLMLRSTNIPTPMFSGIAPVLHTVTLQACKIPSWNSNILPLGHLRHLSLENCGGISVITFIQNLPISLPHLETLNLDTTLVASPASTTLPSPVHFPNLKSFHLLSRTASSLIQLLKLCNLVAATDVDVRVIVNQHETAIDLLQLLQASKRLDHPHIISMGLHDYHVDGSLVIEGLPSPDVGTLSFDVTHEWSWRQIAQIFPGLPLHKVTSLTLAVPEVNLDDWTNVLAQLIHLEQLILDEEHTAQCFMGFIVASTPDNFNDRTTKDLNTHPVLPFRSLRNLRITHNIPGSGADGLATFAAALKVRHDYGLRLEKLYLPEIMMAPYIELLRDVVDQISINAE